MTIHHPNHWLYRCNASYLVDIMNIVYKHEEYRPSDVRTRIVQLGEPGCVDLPDSLSFVEIDSCDRHLRGGLVSPDELPAHVRERAEWVQRIVGDGAKSRQVAWETPEITARVEASLISASFDARMNVIHSSFMELTDERVKRGLVDDNWLVRMQWLARSGYILTLDQAKQALSDESFDVRMAVIRRSDLGLTGIHDLSFIQGEPAFKNLVAERIAPTVENIYEEIALTSLKVESIWDLDKSTGFVQGMTMTYPVKRLDGSIEERSGTVSASSIKKGVWLVDLHEDHPRSASVSSIFSALRWIDNTITNDLKQERMSVSMPSVDRSADQSAMRPD